jgi:two-component system chemotaxis response regulator CheB
MMATAAIGGDLGTGVEAVAIGASSGGVEAVSALLPALRRTCGLAVFVVVHQPRRRPSLLAPIFAQRCALRVCEPVDKDPVRPGTVYVAPPDYHLLVDHGPVITFSTDDPVCFSRPSIDVLFESAADVYRDRLAGIVLSGANDDGAEGLAAIAREGGVALVQDPATAAAGAMCVAALARTPAARALSLAAIAAYLHSLGPSA